MTTVVNVRTQNLKRGCPCCGEKFASLAQWLERDEHVYVGRRNFYVKATFESPFHNPFRYPKGTPSDKAVADFAAYMDTHPDLKKRAKAELRGKALGCWCAPAPCHADILKKIADE